MKNLIALILLIGFISCQKETKENDYVLFQGTVTNKTADTARVSGQDFVAKIPIAENGSFSDTLKIKSNGFYHFNVGRESTSIYLEKGKSLMVNLDANEFDESIKYSGDMAAENNYMAAKFLWDEKNNDSEVLYKNSEDQFKNNLESNKKTIDSLQKSYKITNEDFLKAEGSEIAYNNATAMENYQSGHRYFGEDKNYIANPTFYEGLNKIDFKDTTAFRQSEAYRRLLSSHYQRMVSVDTEDSTDYSIRYLNLVDKNLPNGYAKDFMMYDFLTFGLSPKPSLDQVYAIYKNSDPNPENFAKITERYNKLKTLQAGSPSPSFNFENHKGGTTSLDELKGKYVYIDVWATWCGPCLGEIPSLKKVEEDYHNKKLTFVSVSIDVEKDHETWKNMVNEKQLKGIQLMADNNWKSNFVQEYDILGIPRFILLDPEGKIVLADAPRPSDPALRKLLDGLM